MQSAPMRHRGGQGFDSPLLHMIHFQSLGDFGSIESKKMYLQETNKKNIVKNIRKNFKVKDIILFGSYAYGNPNIDSDLDLLVILDKQGYLENWMERIDLKVAVKKSLKGLIENVPVELLLYTEDEWKKLLKSGSCFYKELDEKGIRLV
jgi:predicted nucleotidyltransferase